MTEDKDYFDDFFSVIFSNQIKEVKPRLFSYWKVYGICMYNKKIISKLVDIGFQKGKKCYDIEIPEFVLKSESEKVKSSFIRGYFDADGSFYCDKSRSKYSAEWKKTHNYRPELEICSCSEKILNQCKLLLEDMGIESKVIFRKSTGFKNKRKNNGSFRLKLRKKEMIERFFKIINSNNPKHITRYCVWKNLGYLPPYTKLKQRKELLKQI